MVQALWACEEEMHGCPNMERLAMDGFRRGRGKPPKKYWGKVIRVDMCDCSLMRT